MKIILNADVYNLGEEGDICDVARGYARNYLFPRNLAVNYSSQNIAILEGRKAAIEKRKEEKRRSALSLKERLDGKEIVIKMNAGNSGRLFGSVTNTMIAEELQKEGFEIEKKKIEVTSHSIKMVGTYPVRIKLYESNEAEIKLKVVSQSGPEKTEAPVAEKKEAPTAEAEKPSVEEAETKSEVEEAVETGGETSLAEEDTAGTDEEIEAEAEAETETETEAEAEAEAEIEEDKG